ncbi:GGDEF domain-containing protein [Catellatospora bangladeshensis]|uniref:GGDEF domain-containing protein n=1 Tax=Catellatospora bangladeshensis TaxID=310355 RepID=UPI003607C8FC
MEHDPLTGLLNRRGLAAAHDRWQRKHHRPLALVFLDLDDFKAVNDTHGHHAGDELLIEVAHRLAEIADLYGGAAARRSGDEFAVLLPAHRDLERTVDAIVAVVSQPVRISIDGTAVELPASASAGVCISEPSDDLDTLLHRADVALYHAKHTWRLFVMHRPGMAMPEARHRQGPRRRDRREQQQVMR